MKIIFFSLLFFLLPGLIFIKSSQFKESACSFIERWLIWIWISFSISSFYLFILASFGLFKTAIIITGWIFINLFLLLARFMSQIAMEPQYPNLSVFKQLGEVVVISIILLILVYLFFQPFEYILGGRDPGVYVNTGYMIAGQGGYRFQNDILAKLDNNFYYENGSIYPGFFISNKNKGEVIPQFFHVFPVWVAFFTLFGNLKTGLLITPLMSLMACLVGYILVKRLWGIYAGLVALALMSLNSIQVYFSRYPSSEMMSQYVLLGSIYCLVLYWDNKRQIWGYLTAIGFGLFLFIRIDSYLILPVLIAVVTLLRVNGFTKIKKIVVIFLVIFIANVLYVFSSAGLYFGIVSRVFNHPKVYLLLPLIFPVVIILSYLLIFRVDLIKKWGKRLPEKKIMIAVSGIFIILFIYWFFIRPQYGDFKNIENINQSLLTPIKLNWFMSPLTILLTAGGLIFLLFRKNENKELIPVLILLFPASVFLWYPLIFPDLMWALRRQLPYGLPLIAILNAYMYSGAWINKKGDSNVVRQGVIVAGLIVLIFIMSNNIGMFKIYQEQRDFQGAIDFISGVNKDLDQGSKSNNLIFFEKRDFEIYNYLSTPVSFLTSENICFVYQKEFDQDFFKKINRVDILNKKNVYLISKRDLSNELFTDYKIQKVDDYMYKARLWERTMDKPPSGYDYFEVNFSIFRIR